MFVEGDVLTNQFVDHAFYLAYLFVADFLKMGEVKSQGVGADIRAFLLDMVAQYLFQGVVEQVGGGMVGGTHLALVGIYACHEVGSQIVWQFPNDMYALVVLTLGVDDGDGLVLAYEHTLVAYLSSHLAIEGCVVEHQLIEGALLLSYLTIAQYVTFVFGEVVAYKLLLACTELHPVAIFYLCSVACSLFLLLHFYIKLLLVHGESVFTAYQLSQVEWESVGVKQAEGVCSIEFGLFLTTLLLIPQLLDGFFK